MVCVCVIPIMKLYLCNDGCSKNGATYSQPRFFTHCRFFFKVALSFVFSRKNWVVPKITIIPRRFTCLALLQLQYLRSHDVVFGFKKVFLSRKSTHVYENFKHEYAQSFGSLQAQERRILSFCSSFSTFTSLSFLLVQLTL